MKAQHKTMLITAIVTIVLIAAINNISAMSALKETINGKSGWF
ncbi:hypothetical protein [Vibrio aestuarianus]|nr:hypothetical protein [Vibrio aestuarianus]